MNDYNKRIIGSYVDIHDGHTFTLNQIPNGSIIVIKFPRNNYDTTFVYFDVFIISKYTDENGENMISFSSIDKPVSTVFTINVNKECIWYHYNPKNIDITDINFGFNKKYLEIVAIYNRIENNKKNDTQYYKELYHGKKYELNTIFLKKFKYEYTDATY